MARTEELQQAGIVLTNEQLEILNLIAVTNRQEEKLVDMVKSINEFGLLTDFLSIVKAAHAASSNNKLRFAAIEQMLTSETQIKYYATESDGANPEEKAQILAACIPIFRMIGIKKDGIIAKSLFDETIKPLFDQCKDCGYSMASLNGMMTGKGLPDPATVKNLWEKCLEFARKDNGEENKDEARRIFASITGMMHGKGLPTDPDKIAGLWNQCLEFAEQNKDEARRIFASITGMMTGKGFPTDSNKIAGLWNQCLEFAKKDNGEENKDEAKRIFASITGMMMGKGFPTDSNKIAGLWNQCLGFAEQNKDEARRILTSITGMMHGKGFPDDKTINHINNLWDWANINELSISEKVSLFRMATQCFKAKGDNFLKDFEKHKEAGDSNDLYSAKLVFAIAYRRDATNIRDAILAISKLKELYDTTRKKIKIDEIKQLVDLKKDSMKESQTSDLSKEQYESLYKVIAKRKRVEVLFIRENIVALIKEEKNFYDQLDPIKKLEFIERSVGAFLREFDQEFKSSEDAEVNQNNEQDVDMTNPSETNLGLLDLDEEFTISNMEMAEIIQSLRGQPEPLGVFRGLTDYSHSPQDALDLPYNSIDAEELGMEQEPDLMNDSDNAGNHFTGEAEDDPMEDKAKEEQIKPSRKRSSADYGNDSRANTSNRKPKTTPKNPSTRQAKDAAKSK